MTGVGWTGWAAIGTGVLELRGMSGRPRAVAVTLTDSGLEMTSSGEKIAVWPATLERKTAESGRTIVTSPNGDGDVLRLNGRLEQQQLEAALRLWSAAEKA